MIEVIPKRPPKPTDKNLSTSGGRTYHEERAIAILQMEELPNKENYSAKDIAGFAWPTKSAEYRFHKKSMQDYLVKKCILGGQKPPSKKGVPLQEFRDALSLQTFKQAAAIINAVCDRQEFHQIAGTGFVRFFFSKETQKITEVVSPASGAVLQRRVITLQTLLSCNVTTSLPLMIGKEAESTPPQYSERSKSKRRKGPLINEGFLLMLLSISEHRTKKESGSQKECAQLLTPETELPTGLNAPLPPAPSIPLVLLFYTDNHVLHFNPKRSFENFTESGIHSIGTKSERKKNVPLYQDNNIRQSQQKKFATTCQDDQTRDADLEETKPLWLHPLAKIGLIACAALSLCLPHVFRDQRLKSDQQTIDQTSSDARFDSEIKAFKLPRKQKIRSKQSRRSRDHYLHKKEPIFEDDVNPTILYKQGLYATLITDSDLEGPY